MAWIFNYAPPIPLAELEALSELLFVRDVFTCPITDLPPDRVYSPATWIEQKTFHNTTVQLHVDRNLVSHIAACVSGRNADSADARYAAAVLAWAQCIDALVDPSIATHEGAATSSAVGALDELRLLQRADNTHPQIWSDIALGRRTAVSASELGSEADRDVTVSALEGSVRDFEVHELALLRYVTLMREARGRPELAAREFIQWMHAEFLWDSTAVCYALAVVGTDAGQAKRPKRADSDNHRRARLGVSNQAWDLTLLSHWTRQMMRMKDSNSIPILASLDVDLHRVARRLPVGASTFDFEDLWKTRWGLSARNLANLMLDLQGSHDAARKQRIATLDRENVDALRMRLDKAFAATFSR